jgi:hypothetical protein
MQTIAKRDRAHKRRRTTYSNSAAIYDGRRYLGVILPHSKDGFRAVDCNKRLVGVFASHREAAAAIMRGVR